MRETSGYSCIIKMKPNPENRRGTKNVFCPHYKVCLDEVIRNGWRYWECSNCCHRFSRQPVTDIPTKLDFEPLEELSCTNQQEAVDWRLLEIDRRLSIRIME